MWIITFKQNKHNNWVSIYFLYISLSFYFFCTYLTTYLCIFIDINLSIYLGWVCRYILWKYELLWSPGPPTWHYQERYWQKLQKTCRKMASRHVQVILNINLCNFKIEYLRVLFMNGGVVCTILIQS